MTILFINLIKDFTVKNVELVIGSGLWSYTNLLLGYWKFFNAQESFGRGFYTINLTKY